MGGCFSGVGSVVSDVFAPAVDIGAAVFAPEVLPELLTAEGVGAGVGAATSALAGGNPLKGAISGADVGAGAEGGALLGGAQLGSTLGISGSTIGETLGGAVGGAAGSGATGTNPLAGGLQGGLTSAIASQLVGTPTSAPQTGGSLAATAAPASVAPSSTSLGDFSQAAPVTNVTSSDLPAPGTSLSQYAPTGQPNTLTGGTQDLINSFANQQAANTPVTDALNPKVIADMNAAAGGTDPTLTQQSLGSQLFNSNAPVAQTSNDIPQNLAGGGGANAPAAAQGNSLLNAIKGTDSWGTALGNNLSMIPSLAGLGLAAVQGNKTLKGQNQVAGEANQLAAQGQQLQSYLQSGTLPPGTEQSINEASASAVAAIRSKYAAMGMSGSSAEQQDIANAEAQAASQGTDIAMNLLKTGINESGIASNLYNNILQTSLGQSKELSNVGSSFFSSLSGGGKPIANSNVTG